jgi:hypothetical protein
MPRTYVGVLGCLQLGAGKKGMSPPAPSQPPSCSGPRLVQLMDAADRTPPGLQFRELDDFETEVAREVGNVGAECVCPPWGVEHVRARRACFNAHASDTGALGVVGSGRYVLCRADGGKVQHACLERVCGRTYK